MYYWRFLVVAETECKTNPTGSGYHGTLNTSASGQPCIDWSTVANYSLTAGLRETNIFDIHNYCRQLVKSNFGVPSCVTLTVNGQGKYTEREEACAVKHCGKSVIYTSFGC